MSDNLKEIKYEFEFGGSKCSLATGKLARRSDSAVIGKMGDTVVLATVNRKPAQDSNEFFPLSVEYVERMFAGGVISSSRFIKREGFPSDEAVLVARMIDRSIRSKFPKDYRDEVQVVVTVLSYDPACDPAIIAFNAVSAALMISDVHFNGPVAGLRVGFDGENLMIYNKDIVNDEAGGGTQMNLVLGTDGELLTMFDADAKQIEEARILEGMKFGVENSKALIDAQNAFAKLVEKERGQIYKPEYTSFETPKELIDSIKASKEKEIAKALVITDWCAKEDALDGLREELFTEFEGKYTKATISAAFEEVCKKIVRKWVIEEHKRMDGRDFTEFRPIDIEVGVLPRAHGSALFTRGMTQALTVATLGSEKLVQLVQGMEGESARRYMHHYNAPDYTVGQAGKYNYRPGRREIGHGALAEKALVPVIPSAEEFPYAIRVVSEVMSQSGSSSMASVCGSTLSLMDAGVPIKGSVAGVAMGVMMTSDMKDFAILTDIAEGEDFYGDMDFKVAGTESGVTAIQMDNKPGGIPIEVLEKGLAQAREGRMFLLGKMNAVINKPREALSQYAPKIEVIEIPKSKIGELIGPGGKNIKAIIEDSGADIDISDDGKVAISATSDESRKKAISLIENITAEAEVGKVYHGKVAKIAEFGVFVDVGPSISGLVHVSEMSNSFVKNPGDLVKEGQDVEVKVIGIDEKGRVKMSMKQVPGANMGGDADGKAGAKPARFERKPRPRFNK